MMFVKPTDTDWIHWASLATSHVIARGEKPATEVQESSTPERKLNDDCHGCRGEFMVRQGGCSTCTQCGYSQCG